MEIFNTERILSGRMMYVLQFLFYRRISCIILVQSSFQALTYFLYQTLFDPMPDVTPVGDVFQS